MFHFSIQSAKSRHCRCGCALPAPHRIAFPLSTRFPFTASGCINGLVLWWDLSKTSADDPKKLSGGEEVAGTQVPPVTTITVEFDYTPPQASPACAPLLTPRAGGSTFSHISNRVVAPPSCSRLEVDRFRQRNRAERWQAEREGGQRLPSARDCRQRRRNVRGAAADELQSLGS